MKEYLSGTLTANASSSEIEWNDAEGEVTVEGAFSAGTVKLEFKRIANWIALGSNTNFTADGVGNFRLGAGKLRLTMSGGGGGISVAFRIDELEDKHR